MPYFRAFLHITTSHEKCAEIFNMMYGRYMSKINPFLNILWMLGLYMLSCSIFYLAVLVVNRAGKMKSLLLCALIAFLFTSGIALFRFVLSAQSKINVINFIMKIMGFVGGGTVNLVFPISLFAGVSVLLCVISYLLIRRAELG